jgi:succinate dehydrogenase / fumarate reductase cytochrome b subunit
MTSINRPKYLNLFSIRLPLPGVVSIAHRLSGVLMFIAIPAMAYVLGLSVGSETGFEQAKMMFGNPFIKIILVVIGWSICHHLYAGIRYLLLDADIGIDLQSARMSAAIVMAAAILSTLLILWVVV